MSVEISVDRRHSQWQPARGLRQQNRSPTPGASGISPGALPSQSRAPHPHGARHRFARPRPSRMQRDPPTAAPYVIRPPYIPIEVEVRLTRERPGSSGPEFCITACRRPASFLIDVQPSLFHTETPCDLSSRASFHRGAGARRSRRRPRYFSSVYGPARRGGRSSSSMAAARMPRPALCRAWPTG